MATKRHNAKFAATVDEPGMYRYATGGIYA